jgi:hypothetical protein
MRHANRYQLFVDRAIALARRGGRIGLVLPSGLATDLGSAPLRRMLFDTCAVEALIGFDNRRGVFPIHRSVRFVLMTASTGRATSRIRCRLDLVDPAQLERLDDDPGPIDDKTVQMTVAALERISGADMSIPWARDARDLSILERAAALFPALGAAAGWGARFGRDLNVTDDRAALKPAHAGPRRGLLPVVEGKHLHAFRVETACVRHLIAHHEAERRLRDRRFNRPRLAYRDVASATNRRTLIAAMLPAECVATHTVFCLRTPFRSIDQWFLCGLFNSFVLDYLVRLRVSTHVTTAVVEQLPVPTERMAPQAFREIAACARALARRADRDTVARLNAAAAALYQLMPEDFQHVLGTFPLVAEEDRAESLKRFRERSR